METILGSYLSPGKEDTCLKECPAHLTWQLPLKLMTLGMQQTEEAAHAIWSTQDYFPLLYFCKVLCPQRGHKITSKFLSHIKIQIHPGC